MLTILDKLQDQKYWKFSFFWIFLDIEKLQLGFPPSTAKILPHMSSVQQDVTNKPQANIREPIRAISDPILTAKIREACEEDL